MEFIERYYKPQGLTGVFDRMKRYKGEKREGKKSFRRELFSFTKTKTL